jgi:hypothetical protein
MAAVPLGELVKGEEYKILKISDNSTKNHGRFHSKVGSYAGFTNTRTLRGSKTPVSYNSKRYRFFPSAQMRKINTLSRQKKLPREIQLTLKKYGGSKTRKAFSRASRDSRLHGCRCFLQKYTE